MVKINDKKYDKIVIYDLETDGYWSNKGYNRPIEFGCVILDKEFITFKNLLIKRRNNSKLRDIITEVTGLTTKIINKYGITIEKAFIDINKIMSNDALICGHNIINFDNKFVNFRLAKYYDRIIDNNNCFDTMPIFKKIMKDLRIDKKPVKYKLDVAIKHYEMDGIWDRSIHSALIDTLYSTLLVLVQLYAKGIISTEMYELYYNSVSNYQPPSDFRLLNITEQIKL